MVDIKILYTLSPDWNCNEWILNGISYNKSFSQARKILQDNISSDVWENYKHAIPWTKVADHFYQIRTDSIPVKTSLSGNIHINYTDTKFLINLDFSESRKTWYAQHVYDNVEELLGDLLIEVEKDLANPILKAKVEKELSSFFYNLYELKNNFEHSLLIERYSIELANILYPFKEQLFNINWSILNNNESLGNPFVWSGTKPFHWEVTRLLYYIVQSFYIIDDYNEIPWTDSLPVLPDYIDVSFLQTRFINSNIKINRTRNLPDDPVISNEWLSLIKEYSMTHHSNLVHEDSFRILWHSALLLEYSGIIHKNKIVFDIDNITNLIADKKFRESIMSNIPVVYFGHGTYLDETLQFWEHGGYLELVSQNKDVILNACCLVKYYFTWTRAKQHSSLCTDKALVLYNPDEFIELKSKVSKTEIEKKLVPYIRNLNKYSNERFYVGIPEFNREYINQKFPNFSEVTDFIFKQINLLKLTRNPVLSLPPVLVHGNPGLGKTRYLSYIANLFHTTKTIMSMSSMTAVWILGGMDLSWLSAKPGKVAETLANGFLANPLFILDEIDKASSDGKYDPLGALYQLLEKHTAANFTDEALQLSMDTSGCLWFATANNINNIPEPILNRFNTFCIDELSDTQIPDVVDSVYAEICANNAWGNSFEHKIAPELYSYFYGLNVRDINALLMSAFANSASREHLNKILSISSFDLIKIEKGNKVGFL